ncbi:MAG: GNAT family N-acetyltransferase, partial [Gammaproteobacteria bacterium]
MAMNFTCYTEWRQLPASADVLFSVAEASSPFLSRQWFATLDAATRSAGRSLLIASVVDDRRVLAMLPLVACEPGHWESLTHRYTPFYNVLSHEAHRQEALTCLAEGLGRLPLQSLRIEPVDTESREMREFRYAMHACGFDSWRRFSAYNWIHSRRKQSYDDYLRERPARLRNTIARKSRKLQRERGYEIRLFRGNEVESGLPDYHAAHAASWKANEQFGSLLNGMAIGLAAPDWTRLAVLYIEG